MIAQLIFKIFVIAILITKEEYDQWRYKYPKLDTSKHWAKVPSQAISDMLMEEFQKIEKEEKKTTKKKKQK